MAIGIHVIFCVVILLFLTMFQAGVTLLGRDLESLFGEAAVFKMCMLLTAISVLGYSGCGLFVLKGAGGKLRDLQSVCGIAVILVPVFLLLWVSDLLDKVNFGLLNLSFMPLMYVIGDHKMGIVLTLLLPSFLLWAGIQGQAWRRKHKG